MLGFAIFGALGDRMKPVHAVMIGFAALYAGLLVNSILKNYAGITL